MTSPHLRRVTYLGYPWMACHARADNFRQADFMGPIRGEAWIRRYFLMVDVRSYRANQDYW